MAFLGLRDLAVEFGFDRGQLGVRVDVEVGLRVEKPLPGLSAAPGGVREATPIQAAAP
jgi:hypothetical protein